MGLNWRHGSKRIERNLGANLKRVFGETWKHKNARSQNTYSARKA